MKLITALAIFSVLISGCGLRAGTQCTDAPESQWQDQDAFQESLVSQGYTIDKFVVTSGNCYEIYGKNKAGQSVEVYFDPVTGDVVKEKME